MVLLIPLKVFESKGLKRMTLPKLVANHLNIKKGDTLWMFLIGETVCISKTKKAASDFIKRIDLTGTFTFGFDDE